MLSIESIQIYVDNLMVPIIKALGDYQEMHDYEQEHTEISMAQMEQILTEIVNKTN